jgi:hypothetical protein
MPVAGPEGRERFGYQGVPLGRGRVQSMSSGDEGRRLRAELESLRRELAEMRAEQRVLAQMIDQMHQTFRQIAIQLGIGAEPYRKKEDPSKQRDLPGFA